MPTRGLPSRLDRPRTLLTIGAVALLAVLANPAAFAQNAVETVVTNGKILTVDADFRIVQAVAIDGGRIVARGTREEVGRYVGPNTRVIDVSGATVIPGLIDNHFHLTRAVDTWHHQARFEGIDSRARALEILATKAAGMPAGEWVMVQGGWTPRQFADAPGGFTLEELDRVAPRNPLFVQEGYSVVYANSLALKAVGLNPADGAKRNAAGLASFQPPAKLLEAIPPASAGQLEQNLTDFLRALNAAGLTGAYSLGQSALLAARAAKGPLPVRLWETLAFNATDPASAARAAALIERSRPNQFDGRFGIFGLGEVLYGPFFDLSPRPEPWPAGIMNEYGKLATAAARGGWHVHQHVINNTAVTDLLDTLESVNASQRLDHLRWTLGHVYDISPANLARAKALGLTLGVHGAAMQAAARMPLRQIADSGIVFGLGTDATIVSHYSPFVTLGWVVSGLDVGGNRVLDETLTREEALIAHTRSNAYLFFQEKTLGSLEVGKQADLVVLDRDYLTVPAAQIRNIRPTLTMVGGRVVYRAAPVIPDRPGGARPARLSSPRLTPLAEAQWTDVHKGIVAKYAADGRPGNALRTLLNMPELADNLMTFQTYLIKDSTLTPRHREILILRTGWLLNSDYLWSEHAPAARQAGLTADEVRRVAEGPDARGWTPFEATLLRLADQLFRNSFVNDAVYKALIAEYDLHHTMDAIMTVNNFTTLGLMYNALGIQPDSWNRDRIPATVPYRVVVPDREPPLAAARVDPVPGTALAVNRTFARHPALAAARTGSNYVNRQSKLDPRYRELMILRTGWNCRSEYEWAQHVGSVGRAREMGMPVENIARGADAPGWTPIEQALLTAADELYRDSFISDGTWSSLSARLDPVMIVNALISAANYRLVSMSLNAFGVQLEPGDERFPAIGAN